MKVWRQSAVMVSNIITECDKAVTPVIYTQRCLPKLVNFINTHRHYILVKPDYALHSQNWLSLYEGTKTLLKHNQSKHFELYWVAQYITIKNQEDAEERI